MKVIKKGTLPQAVKYQGECSRCKAVVQFAREEAKVYSHRNETYYSVQCPTKGCGASISVEDLPANRVTS
jgi:hypothetical protein